MVEKVVLSEKNSSEKDLVIGSLQQDMIEKEQARQTVTGSPENLEMLRKEIDKTLDLISVE